MADPTSKAFLDAYSAGVNAYISGRSGPQLALEFSLLDVQGIPYEIEPWTP